MTAATLALLITAAPPTVGESFQFLGFSGNEQLAGWAVTVVEERPGGMRDRYGLYLVADAVTSEVLQVYRGAAPTRVGPSGKRIAVSERRLAADNPRWAEATPTSEWRRLRGRARFFARPLAMDDSTLRLDPDRDVDLQATAGARTIEGVGAAGSPVGYHVVVRRFDGALLDLGHYRVEAPEPGHVELEVRAYFSRSGYGLAVLNTFRIVGDAHEAGASRVVSLARVARLHKAPVATMLIGRFNSVKTSLEEAQRLYSRVHPEYSDHYDDLVRTHW